MKGQAGRIVFLSILNNRNKRSKRYYKSIEGGRNNELLKRDLAMNDEPH